LEFISQLYIKIIYICCPIGLSYYKFLYMFAWAFISEHINIIYICIKDVTYYHILYMFICSIILLLFIICYLMCDYITLSFISRAVYYFFIICNFLQINVLNIMRRGNAKIPRGRVYIIWISPIYTVQNMYNSRGC